MNEMSEKLEPSVPREDKQLESLLGQINEEIMELESLQSAASEAVSRLVGSAREGQEGIQRKGSGDESFIARFEHTLERLRALRVDVQRTTDSLSDAV